MRIVALIIAALALVTLLAANTADQEPYWSGPFSGAVTTFLSPEEDDPGFDCHVHGNRVCGPNHG